MKSLVADLERRARLVLRLARPLRASQGLRQATLLPEASFLGHLNFS